MASQGPGQIPSGSIHGPPYPPAHQGLGGTPSVIPDVPVNAVFLFLFVLAAAAHMTLFQINLHKRGKLFAFNAAIFGYCFTRIIATSLRIAWAYHEHNISLAMAAQIFVYAGVIVLFICNLFFSQRIVRAQHPLVGWSKPFSIWLPISLALMVLTILALIVAVIAQFYIQGDYTQEWTRDIQLCGAVLFAFFAVLPIPIVIISQIAAWLPKHRDTKEDNFGKGKMGTKIILVLITATLLSLGAWYRAVTSLLSPISIRQATPWYFSKPCFYMFNFGIEIVVVYFWMAVRIDKRYIIPNGADRPMSYAGGIAFAGEYPHDFKSTDELFKARASTRTSLASTIIPPPQLSRAGSWGSLRHYMSRDGSKHNSPSLWGGISQEYVVDKRVDSAMTEYQRSEGQFSFELTRPAPIRSQDGQMSREMGYNPNTGRWDEREWQLASPSVPSVHFLNNDGGPRSQPAFEMPSIYPPSADHIATLPAPPSPRFMTALPAIPRTYTPSGHPSTNPSASGSRRPSVENFSRPSTAKSTKSTHRVVYDS